MNLLFMIRSDNFTFWGFTLYCTICRHEINVHVQFVHSIQCALMCVVVLAANTVSHEGYWKQYLVKL